MGIADIKDWFKDSDDFEEKKPINKVKEGSTNQTMLVQPRAFSESQQIADYLKNDCPVIVNMKRVTTDQAKRIVDFLSGCVYAIGGDMKKVGSGIFYYAPRSMAVEGNIEEYGSKEKKDDIELDF